MTDPVRVKVEVADLEKILGIWEECAEDLKSSVDAEYASRRYWKTKRPHEWAAEWTGV